MRIGLYGGLGNAMYVFAKAFARFGHAVCFIRDRTDTYPFSQPVWEDAVCELEHDRVKAAQKWTWRQWTDFEKDHGWNSPAWVADPLKKYDLSNKHLSNSVKNQVGFVDRALLDLVSKRRQHWPAAVNLMADCDILLVCGMEGSLLALMSGRPYVIWPHGWDIRFAAGFHPPRSRSPREWLGYSAHVHLLRRAYKHALRIGSHDPLGVGGHIGDTQSVFEKSKFAFLPMPVTIREQLPRERRRELLSRLMTRFGLPIPAADFIAFVPSRLDFFWKGHDRLFQALAQIPNAEKKLHLIFSGWGNNYREGQKMASAKQATFLPYAISKPILYDFYRAADLVVDQFLMGTYGAAAIEAMSSAKPVLMWIDEAAFRHKNWQPPPVLNGKQTTDIARILKEIISGHTDLEKEGYLAQQWARNVHGEEAVVTLAAAAFTGEMPQA